SCRRNVLHSGVIAEQVVGGDPVNFRIIKDGPQGSPEPLNILLFGRNEHIKILGKPRKPVKIESHGSENRVANTEPLKSVEDSAQSLEVHPLDSTDTFSAAIYSPTIMRRT